MIHIFGTWCEGCPYDRFDEEYNIDGNSNNFVGH